MINKVVLVGFTGKDAEVKQVGESKLATFSVATSDHIKLPNGEWKELTEWHTIETWRGMADRAERLIKKGLLVYIEGKIKHIQFEDESGKKKYITRISASDIRVLEKRKEQENQSNNIQNSHANSNLDVTYDGNHVSQMQVHANMQDDLPF